MIQGVFIGAGIIVSIMLIWLLGAMHPMGPGPGWYYIPPTRTVTTTTQQVTEAPSLPPPVVVSYPAAPTAIIDQHREGGGVYNPECHSRCYATERDY